MSWFNASGISSFAKSAISQAQKSIDKVLDIQEENDNQDVRNKGIKSNSSPRSRSSNKISSGTQNNERYIRSDSGGSNLHRGCDSQEEESFFSSFLGSDRQSTPKSKATVKKESHSSSAVISENPESASRNQEGRKGSALSLLPKSRKPGLNTREERNTKNGDEEENRSKNIVNVGRMGNGKKVESSKDVNVTSDDITKNESISDKMKHNDNKDEVEEMFDDTHMDIVNKLEGMKLQSDDKDIDDNSKNYHDDSGDDDDDDDDGSGGEKSDCFDALHSVSSNFTKDFEKEDDLLNAAEVSEKLSEKCSEELLENWTEKAIEKHSVKSDGEISYDNEEGTNIDAFSGESKSNTENERPSFHSLDSETFVNDSKVEKAREASNTIENEMIQSLETILKDSCQNDAVSCEILKEECRNGLNEYECSNENQNVDNCYEIGHASVSLIDTLGVLDQGNDLENCKKNGQGDKIPGCDISENKVTEQRTGEQDLILAGKNRELERGEGGKEIEEIVDVDMDSLVKEKDTLGRNHTTEEGKDEVKESYEKSEERQEKADVLHNEAECSKTGEDRSVVASNRMVELEKDVTRLQEVVDARESKMVTLSKENINLLEAVSILRNQLEQAEQVESGDNEVIREMRDEFTKIVDELRTELKRVKKERDELNRDLEETTERLTKSSDELIHDYTITLKDKDEQIAQLLAEGEALSKKELKSNNVLKKFRGKVKSLEEGAEQKQKKMEEKDSELAKLKETLKDTVEQEKVYEEQVKKLELITDQQEDEISKMKDQLDDAEDRMKGMQTTLDSGYQEINRLSLEKANRESEIEEISRLKMTKTELENKIVQIEEQAKDQMLSHQEEIKSLRVVLSRTEQTSVRREDGLQTEIKDLQHRLEGAETRNQELSQSIASASRPLLRQIENLQSSHQNQAQNWERIEKSLNERLAAAQQQLVLVTEKERSAMDFAMEMKSRVTSLEIQVKTLGKQKEGVTNDLEDLREKSKNLEDAVVREKKSFETYQANYRKAFEALQNEKTFIENQLNAERAKYEAEIFRMSNEVNGKRQLSRQNSSNTMQGAMYPARTDADEVDADALPSVAARSRTSSSSSSSNLIDAANRHASTAVMEKLQTQLRQKDGELKVHKEEIATLQNTRSSLAEELVDLSNLVEELKEKISDYDSMKQNYQATESRYNAALQLYGEKAEEADELRMDLEDVKQMYKQQIQQLIGDR